MIGFISDVHGNFPALSAVLQKLDETGVLRVYSLGDVAGYYPMVDDCIALMRERKVTHILGNHDDYLVNHKIAARSMTVNRLIEYQRKRIKPEHLAWLAASGDHLDEPEFFAVHGGIHDYLDEYVVDFQFPESIPQRLFLSGHTHMQKRIERDEYTYCNPGSVGQPRDGDPRAAFAVLDASGALRLARTEYDIDAIVKSAKAAGFSPRIYEGLYTGEGIKPYRSSGEDSGQ
jgi:predicted phosphodiesterase